MSKHSKFLQPWFLLGLLLAGLLVVEACKKDDETDPNKIELLSFGPSPALRGGELRFIGTNLDKVTAVVLPVGVEVTTFTTKTSELLVLTIPEATVEGKVTLKTPQGDIVTKTPLTISEPIALTSFSPAQARPGDKVTIEGTYLNLIKEVIFSNKKSVLSTAFVSQSATKIEVIVPQEAQTGVITISNGLADPILVESTAPLTVTLPATTQLGPQPVKAGATLTIDGTDLDLVKEVVFTGGSKATTFASQSASKIEVVVPADAKEGPIKLVAFSLTEVPSTATLTLVVPTITSITPDPAKTGGVVTVKGTNLDLVTKVTFNGNKTGTNNGGTAAEITVQVPVDALDGSLTLTTAADKTVTSGPITFVKPVIASLAPLDVQFNDEITVTGSDLDIVAKVRFGSGLEVNPSSVTASELKASVPVGTTAGAITLITTNGSEVSSSQALNILASTNATITSMPTSAKPGEMIDIVGLNLDEITEVIFPGGVSATMFGQKTETLIQVVIPATVQTGIGTIQLITSNGEIVTTPAINIQGVDPVTDPTLVFFNFDGLNAWWGDAGAPENDPALSVDGTSYHRVNTTCNGWTGFFWRNGANNFPGSVIGTNVSQYVLKFDINVLDPITGGEFAWRLKGSSGDFWYYWKPWASSGSYKTDGWITVTIPLTDFSNGTNGIADLSTITEDFGVAFNNGSSQVNVCIDNVRFQQL